MSISALASFMLPRSGFSASISSGASFTFCSAVYWGKRLKDWNTNPKCSLFLRISSSLGTEWASESNSVSPFTVICPSSGLSRKFRHLKSVVLPEPEEPIMASTSPFSREKSSPFNTSVSPKFFFMFFTSSIGISLHPEIVQFLFYAAKDHRQRSAE